MFSTTQKLCNNLNNPVKSGLNPLFALNYGSTSLPTTDNAGRSLTYTNTGGILSMYNDATRGYVLKGAGGASVAYFIQPTFSVPSGGPYTLMFWVNTSSMISSQVFWLFNTSIGINYQYIKFMSGGLSTAQVNIPFTYLTWTHITFAVSTTTLNVYKNGVSFASYTGMSNSLSPTWSYGANRWMCGDGATPAYNLIGYVDNIQIYNGVLSATDISTLYNAQLTSPTA